MAQLLKSNDTISLQLRELIARRSEDPASESCTLFGGNFYAAAELSAPPRENDAASMGTTATSDGTLYIRSVRSMLPSFTDNLKNSTAYKRAPLWGAGFDYQTSSFFTNSTYEGWSWSMLLDMGLGLSISEISAVELPVQLHDVWDSSLYESAPPSPRQFSCRLKPKWSSRGRIHNAIEEGNEYVVRTLLAMGAEIDERGAYEMTPLHCAFYNGQIAIARLLIEKGAAMYTRDIDGWTVLHCALASRRLDVVAYLLVNKGREFVNARDDNGDTVACWLVRSCDLSGIKKLVAAGASLSRSNSNGMTPFQLARGQAASSEIASYLWSQLSPYEQLLQGPRFDLADESADVYMGLS